MLAETLEKRQSAKVRGCEIQTSRELLECEPRRTLDSLNDVFGRGRPLLLGVRSLPETEARLLGSSPARRSRRLREPIMRLPCGALRDRPGQVNTATPAKLSRLPFGR